MTCARLVIGTAHAYTDTVSREKTPVTAKTDLAALAMDLEVVIGLEVHAQLLTESKMFCSCNALYQAADPNTVVCEICMGMPGVLPVINKRAVEFVIRTGLAFDCTIADQTKFDRKNYPYADLMKGYQISQYDQPIAADGELVVATNGAESRIGITRVHLEEDVARLLHRNGTDGQSYSLLDINRSGVPLMEIVSEPDMRSSEEARSYLVRLHSVLRYIDVSTANMEEGSFRCDANISVRPAGSEQLGSKVEVKNMNSFRSVYNALEYEARRQTRLAKEGPTHQPGDPRLGRGPWRYRIAAHQGVCVRLSLLPRARPASLSHRPGMGR